MENNLVLGKILVLDSLRAFAALSVCFFHFICTVTGFIQTDWILNIFSIGQYGVQLFFVVSGFVIPWSMYNAKYEIKHFFKFFLKRISRLEPPYLFSILLALLILYLREKYLGRSNAHMDISLRQVVLHLGYLIPFFEGYQWLNQVYWTLAIEFQYYLFIALLFIPLTRSSIWIRFLIYGSIFMLSLHNDSRFLLYWLPLFLLGILLFMSKTQIISKKEYYLVSLCVTGFGFYVYPFWAMIYALIPLIMVLFYSDIKLWVIDSLGKFSYSIYLIHSLVGASLINVFSHYCTSGWMKVLVILLGLCTTILAAWLTYLFIERPSKKLSASIKYESSS